MRYGIPILGNRIAPRCTFAEALLLVVRRRDRARRENMVELANRSLAGLLDAIAEFRVDTLICGGIDRACRDRLTARHVTIIDNVAGTIDELLAALRAGVLRRGYGLAEPVDCSGASLAPETATTRQATDTAPPDGERIETKNGTDCLACQDRRCLRGLSCHLSDGRKVTVGLDAETSRMLEASLDISSERERTLCRLSELIYFCLEMRYKRIGVAYCDSLREPAEILVSVLRRFFQVFPVSCKVGGAAVEDPMHAGGASGQAKRVDDVACNPRMQATVLNDIGTDLNVMVGICMGADCVFTSASESPVTTLFVKDRSLANNPIGAVYSDYYLNEAVRATSRTT